MIFCESTEGESGKAIGWVKRSGRGSLVQIVARFVILLIYSTSVRSPTSNYVSSITYILPSADAENLVMDITRDN